MFPKHPKGLGQQRGGGGGGDGGCQPGMGGRAEAGCWARDAPRLHQARRALLPQLRFAVVHSETGFSLAGRQGQHTGRSLPLSPPTPGLTHEAGKRNREKVPSLSSLGDREAPSLEGQRIALL